MVILAEINNVPEPAASWKFNNHYIIYKTSANDYWLADTNKLQENLDWTAISVKLTLPDMTHFDIISVSDTYDLIVVSQFDIDRTIYRWQNDHFIKFQRLDRDFLQLVHADISRAISRIIFSANRVISYVYGTSVICQYYDINHSLSWLTTIYFHNYGDYNFDYYHVFYEPAFPYVKIVFANIPQNGYFILQAGTSAWNPPFIRLEQVMHIQSPYYSWSPDGRYLVDGMRAIYDSRMQAPRTPILTLDGVNNMILNVDMQGRAWLIGKTDNEYVLDLYDLTQRTIIKTLRTARLANLEKDMFIPQFKPNKIHVRPPYISLNTGAEQSGCFIIYMYLDQAKVRPVLYYYSWSINFFGPLDFGPKTTDYYYPYDNGLLLTYLDYGWVLLPKFKIDYFKFLADDEKAKFQSMLLQDTLPNEMTMMVLEEYYQPPRIQDI